MKTPITRLMELMGIEVSYSIWVVKGDSSECIPLINEEHMPQPAVKIRRRQPVHVIQGVRNNTVQFTYSEDYAVIMQLKETVNFTDDELSLLFDFFYKGYAEYVDRTGRAKLGRIVDSVSYTTASLNLEDVFSSILTHTLDVISNADYGTLWLFDETRQKLICKASEGYRFEEIKLMEFEVGEGPVGYAFKVGHPVLINNLKEASEETVKKISNANKKKWGRRVEDITNVRSIIAYPIGVDGKIECVMYLGQMYTEQVLTERDLWLLQIFTTQVGIAIRNAKQFASIRELNEKLVQRDAIHAALTDLSVRNLGTDKIIEELSRMADQPLVFADLLLNEIIPSTATLPSEMSFRKLLHSIQHEEQATRIPWEEHSNVVLYPIRSGSVVLGCLIAKDASSLTRIGELALEQGSGVLALERVQKQNVLAFYYKNQRGLFEEMLQTTDPEIVLEKAEALGIREATGYVAAIFQITGCSDPQELEAQIFRLLANVRSVAASHIQIVFGWQNRIIMLAGVEGPVELTLFTERLETLFEDLSEEEQSYRLNGGIGSLIHSINHIERTYREAEIALTNPLSARVSPALVKYTDIGISRLFTSRNTEEVGKFLTDIFEPLREADRFDGTLEQTLLAYFASNRSVGEAAASLHIHINTLYQRLKKIEDVLSLSFKDADDVLQLQLACYLRQRS